MSCASSDSTAPGPDDERPANRPSKRSIRQCGRNRHPSLLGLKSQKVFPTDQMRLPIFLFQSFIGLLAVASISGAARATGLVNGGFEGNPVLTPGTSNIYNQSAVDGWKTTATDSKIEIWSSGFQGVSAYEGNQFAELNAFEAAALYQDVGGISAGNRIGYKFAHRARIGTDVMRLTITDLGGDGIFGGGDDTVLYTNTYSDTTAAWGVYAAGNVATALGNTIRFSYEAVSTGSGIASSGNFLDAASFGVGVGVPAPLPILGTGVAFGFSRRLRRRIRSASTID